MKIRTLIHDLVGLVYPDLCLACNSYPAGSPDGICIQCLSSLPITSFHLYPDNPMASIFGGRLNIGKATAYLYFEKNGITQRLLHLLKYKNEPGVGTFLGSMAGRELLEGGFMNDVDAFIPIPLHPEKLRRRGYNQSQVIGEAMAEITGIKILSDLVIRKTHTSSQTRKGRFDRWANVKDVFEVTNPELVQNKHLMLVDDVVTTGSTIEACALSLQKFDGVKISVFCLAFAP